MYSELACGTFLCVKVTLLAVDLLQKALIVYIFLYIFQEMALKVHNSGLELLP